MRRSGLFRLDDQDKLPQYSRGMGRTRRVYDKKSRQMVPTGPPHAPVGASKSQRHSQAQQRYGARAALKASYKAAEITITGELESHYLRCAPLPAYDKITRSCPRRRDTEGS